MGTVPLLTREARWPSQSSSNAASWRSSNDLKHATIAKRMLADADQLRAGERTIRELVIFSDEEITDEVIQERAVEVLRQDEDVRKARMNYTKPGEKLETVIQRRTSVSIDARSGGHRRALIGCHAPSGRSEFTETVKRRPRRSQDAVDAVSKVPARGGRPGRLLNPKVKAKGPQAEGGGKENAQKKLKDP